MFTTVLRRVPGQSGRPILSQRTRLPVERFSQSFVAPVPTCLRIYIYMNKNQWSWWGQMLNILSLYWFWNITKISHWSHSACSVSSRFLLLWSAVLIMYPTTLAVIALTFSSYVLQPVFPDCVPPYMATRMLSTTCLCKWPPSFWLALQWWCAEPSIMKDDMQGWLCRCWWIFALCSFRLWKSLLIIYSPLARMCSLMWLLVESYFSDGSR